MQRKGTAPLDQSQADKNDNWRVKRHLQLLPCPTAVSGGIVCAAAVLGAGWMVSCLVGVGVLFLLLCVAAVNGRKEQNSGEEQAVVTSGRSLSGASILGLHNEGYRAKIDKKVNRMSHHSRPARTSILDLIQDRYSVTSGGELESWTGYHSRQARESTQSLYMDMIQAARAQEEDNFTSYFSCLAGTSTLSLVETAIVPVWQEGCRMTCGLEVENWTRYHLVHPHVQLFGGTLTLGPSAVDPGTKEVMIARKSSGEYGCSGGTVSWLIKPMKRRLVIMWRASNLNDNWLGVGLTAEGVTEHAPDDAWYFQMCDGESCHDLRFEREKYQGNICPVFVGDGEFEAEGIIDSDHKAMVKVILRPTDLINFANSIKKKMKIV